MYFFQMAMAVTTHSETYADLVSLSHETYAWTCELTDFLAKYKLF
jgi:hypothetical protein